MLKKKRNSKPNDHDFSALDEAVSELNKQTEALLGKTDQKAKPALPKKHHKPQSKGKSFDIINHPKGSGTKATLKTAVPVNSAIKIKTDQSPPLLPDHAGKSYNELETSENTEPEIKEVRAPAAIEHHEGKLQLDQAPPAEVTPVIDGLVSNDLEQSKPAVAPSQGVSHTSISFEAENKAKEEAPAEPESKPDQNNTETQSSLDDSKKAEENSQPEESENTEEAVEPPAYNSGELFANNLVKESRPKGYKPAKDQQKPTVFDTNEYHPELHDWSKLEHKAGTKWFLLLLLVVVLGGLVYFIVLGHELPFL